MLVGFERKMGRDKEEGVARLTMIEVEKVGDGDGGRVKRKIDAKPKPKPGRGCESE